MHQAPFAEGPDSDHTPHHHKPKLLDQVRAAVRVRHYSLRTEQAYIHWIKRFIFFHNKRHPASRKKNTTSIPDSWPYWQKIRKS